MEKVRIAVYLILVFGITILVFATGSEDFCVLEAILMGIISAIFFAPFFLGWNDEKEYGNESI